MNNSYVSKLNADCIFEIFRQIKTRCEIKNSHFSEPFIKYGELFKFVVCFQWIYNLFKHWDRGLYDMLYYRHNENMSRIDINFDDLYWELREATPKQQNMFLEFLIDGINKMKELCEVSLIYEIGQYNENHLEFAEMIVNACQKKCVVIHLTIKMKGYTIGNLSHFHNLIKLELDMKINADELVECCKSNPYLRELSIENNEIYGRLSDITLDKNNLQRLKKLCFVMKTEMDAAEYAPLANLPKLKDLSIGGTHEMGSLKLLFRRLAERNMLCELNILNVDMNEEEIHAISQIESLKGLQCGFIESASIRHLSHLNNLERLVIYSKNEVVNTINNIVNMLMASKTKWIRIHFCQAQFTYEESSLDIENVFPYQDELYDDDDCQYPYQVQNPFRHEDIDYKTIGLVCLNLFKAFANQNLLRLKVQSEHNMFGHDRNKMLAIAGIKSLKNINCVFDDLCNIDIFGQLPYLEELTIGYTSVRKGLMHLKRLFKALAEKACPTLKSLDLPYKLSLDLPSTTELVRIKSLKTLKCWFSNDECIKLLDKLTELEDLEIKSTHHDFSNISEKVLRILSSSKSSVQINNIFSYNSHSKELKLQVSNEIDASRYGPLGNLENCESLIISGKCPSGSLHSLIKTLSSNESHNLKILHIDKMPINYEETLLIKQIKTLQIINCIFSDPRCLEVDLPLAFYKRIVISEIEIPIPVLKFSDGVVIIKHDKEIIKYHTNQGKLIIQNFLDICDYAFLKKLKNLNKLHILKKGTSNLTKILSYLAENSSFKELIIDDTHNYIDNWITKGGQYNSRTTFLRGETIHLTDFYSRSGEKMYFIEYQHTNDSVMNYEEVLHIAKIASLRKLICGFSKEMKKENLQTLAQLKDLQELAITSHPFGSLEGLFKGFSLQTSSTLQYLVIKDKITINELKAIAGIKSLKALKCSFDDPETDEILPAMPVLSELSTTNCSNSKLRLFKNCPLQFIKLNAYNLHFQDIAPITEYKLLRKLDIQFLYQHQIEILSLLKELEELNITFPPPLPVPTPIYFNVNFQKLRKLTLKNVYVEINQLDTILELPALKSLCCSFDLEEEDNLARLGQLEELIASSLFNSSIDILLQALVEQTPRTLKHLGIFANLKYVSKFSIIKKLTDLITLKLCSDNFVSDSSMFLNILENCTKLEHIELRVFKYMHLESACSILYKALDILKMVRDPILQEPLKLVVSPSLYTFFCHLTASDKKYLNVECREIDWD